MIFCLAFLQRGLVVWEDQSTKIRKMPTSEKNFVLCGNLRAGWSNLNEMLTDSSEERQFDRNILRQSVQWSSFEQKLDDYCSLHQPDWLGFEIEVFQLGGGTQPISWTFRPKIVAP